MEIREGLTYDDVLMSPEYSEVISRSTVDLSVKLPKGIKLQHPLIPANMKNVCGKDMAYAFYKTGGLSILHRFMPLEEQIKIFVLLHMDDLEIHNHVGVSIGIKEEDKESVKQFVKIGVKIICIDVAHGDSKGSIEMCKWISENYPDILLIAGNVATAGGARRLWEAGSDIVKVGIGPSTICTTRIQAGAGVPQLTAIMDVAAERERLLNTGIEFWKKELLIIADGGLSNSGNCVKALAFADLIMAGSLFAGTDESPGDTVIVDGVSYKKYEGSSTHKLNHVEGVKALVPIKGPVFNIIKSLIEGIKSGCSYQGVSNLIDLKDNPKFIRITNAGIRESNHHDVKLQ